jgi:hypothetical protein
VEKAGRDQGRNQGQVGQKAVLTRLSRARVEAEIRASRQPNFWRRAVSQS